MGKGIPLSGGHNTGHGRKVRRRRGKDIDAVPFIPISISFSVGKPENTPGEPRIETTKPPGHGFSEKFVTNTKERVCVFQEAIEDSPVEQQWTSMQTVVQVASREGFDSRQVFYGFREMKTKPSLGPLWDTGKVIQFTLVKVQSRV